MRIGGSLALILVGAALRWAVTYTHAGISIPAIGTIVIVVGVIGLLLSLILKLIQRRPDATSAATIPAEVHTPADVNDA